MKPKTSKIASIVRYITVTKQYLYALLTIPSVLCSHPKTPYPYPPTTHPPPYPRTGPTPDLFLYFDYNFNSWFTPPPPPPPDFFSITSTLGSNPTPRDLSLLSFHNNFNSWSKSIHRTPPTFLRYFFCILTITSILGSHPSPPPSAPPLTQLIFVLHFHNNFNYWLTSTVTRPHLFFIFCFIFFLFFIKYVQCSLDIWTLQFCRCDNLCSPTPVINCTFLIWPPLCTSICCIGCIMFH